MSLWQLVCRELYQMAIIDKRRSVFVFGASLAYLVLFGLLYCTHTINSVPVVIYDEDQTRFSRELIQAFDDSERFRIFRYAATQEEMEQVMEEKKTYAAIQIPKKFAQDAKSGHSTTVLLMVDGANILVANTVSTAAQEIIATFSKNAGAELVEATLGQMPALAKNKVVPTEMRLRILNNPTQSYLPFFVPGLAMAAIQQGIFLAVGASIQHEFQCPRELLTASSWQAMFAKLLSYSFSAIIAFFLTIEVGMQTFQIPSKAPLLYVFLLAVSFIVCAVSVSALLASLSNSELTFTRISIAYSVPAFVMSGYTWPQESMGPISKALSYLFPLSYFSNTLRELMLAGYSAYLYRHCVILLSIGVVSFYLATRCFGAKHEQKIQLSSAT